MPRDVLDEHRLRRLIDVGRDLVAQLDLEAALGEVVEAARELTGAHGAALGIFGEDRREVERFVCAGIDEKTWGGTYGFPAALGPAQGLLSAPIVVRGQARGRLCLAEKVGSEFGDADQEVATVLAEWAAMAIFNAGLYAESKEERLRQNLLAAERERARWARELHDSVLQGMGSRRVLLSAALKSGDPERLASAVEEGLRDVVRDIDDLRRLITELRPATLDQLGLVAALEDLAERAEHSAAVELAADLEIDAARLDPELETVVYRLAQEALNNVAKHAGANTVRLEARCGEERLNLLVADDGCGFDPTANHSGFGLAGMRERVDLADGELRIESSAGEGTRVMASLPLPAPPGGDSGLDQAAGEGAAN